MTDTSSDTLPAPVAPALSKAQQSHVINLVRRAAKAEILPRFRHLATTDIEQKGRPDDLVTVADKAAEAMIARGLQIAFPSALVIGEEAVAAHPELLDKIADAALAFIIDPIDGTWNFAHGQAAFGVIIAVTRFGKPAFGLLYDPLMDDWIVADEENAPTFHRSYGAPRKLRVSMGKQISELSGYIPLHLLPHDKRAAMAATFPSFGRIRTVGSSCHEYRMLAQGHVDFCLTGKLMPWDHAAGALICAKAGGHVEMLSGGDYRADLREGYLLSAPDRSTWNKLRKVFEFLLDTPEER